MLYLFQALNENTDSCSEVILTHLFNYSSVLLQLLLTATLLFKILFEVLKAPSTMEVFLNVRVIWFSKQCDCNYSLQVRNLGFESFK